MIRPFYKNLKVGDRVLVKKYNQEGTVKQLLPNPLIQFLWEYPNYLVDLDDEGDVFKRSELKLLK